MAKNNRPHLLLKNKIKKTTSFNISRGADTKKEEKPEVLPELYANQKENFKGFKSRLISERQKRKERRQLVVPSNIEYVKIYFFSDFNDSLSLKFESKFGLVPVYYEDLNQTITLAINNENSFENFLNELDLFINSNDSLSPKGQSYSDLITMHKFEFLSSSIIFPHSQDGNIIIRLVDGLRVINKFEKIQKKFQSFLQEKGYDWGYIYNDIIEIKKISAKDSQLIIDNFDIIEAITSFKIFTRYPGTYGDSLITQYDIVIDEEAPLVGIIDTGVSRNRLLEDIIVDFELDLTNKSNPKTYNDVSGHGTSIAGLVAYGKQMYYSEKELINDARIVPIKVINDDEGTFSISDLLDAITIANQKGVRIFSLSINLQTIKKYNEGVSYYAYLLDKLSFELDILIFISTGNLDREFVEEYHSNPDFIYPKHLFNPNFDKHNEEGYDCSETNINPPADSMNNMTVGAIAENFEFGYCDISLDKKYPTYYSKKWNISINHPVNGAKRVKKSQFNNKIFKPDVLNAGGDMLSEGSAMKVISNDFAKPYFRRAGSSLSAPLTANLAAKILKRYPTIRMQTVKALIVNSSDSLKLESLTQFKDLILSIQKRFSKKIIGKRFNNFDELERSEKTKLSNAFSIKNLRKSISGHGIPNDELALNSSDKRITFVLEESIKIESYTGFYINFPKYVENLANNTSSNVFKVSATLTFNFDPIYANSLAYNPLHISFNILNDINKDLDATLKLLSIKHSKEDIANKNAATKAYFKGKGSLPWSDDFYPINSKPFSNCQKIEQNITRKNLLELVNNFVVIVRCNAKSTAIASEEFKKLKEQSHDFSMIIAIEEVVEDPTNITGNLYDEMENENIVESILDINTDIDLTLG